MDITVPEREAELVQEDKKSTEVMFTWMQRVSEPPQRFTGTIVTAAITGGGVNGSMTFVNGVLVSQVAAT